MYYGKQLLGKAKKASHQEESDFFAHCRSPAGPKGLGTLDDSNLRRAKASKYRGVTGEPSPCSIDAGSSYGLSLHCCILL